MTNRMETPVEMRAYPPALRKQLADLDLPAPNPKAAAVLVAEAKATLGLDASWQDEPCPLYTEHNPNGTQMVWWRVLP